MKKKAQPNGHLHLRFPGSEKCPEPSLPFCSLLSSPDQWISAKLFYCSSLPRHLHLSPCICIKRLGFRSIKGFGGNSRQEDPCNEGLRRTSTMLEGTDGVPIVEVSHLSCLLPKNTPHACPIQVTYVITPLILHPHGAPAVAKRKIPTQSRIHRPIRIQLTMGRTHFKLCISHINPVHKSRTWDGERIA